MRPVMLKLGRLGLYAAIVAAAIALAWVLVPPGPLVVKAIVSSPIALALYLITRPLGRRLGANG